MKITKSFKIQLTLIMLFAILVPVVCSNNYVIKTSVAYLEEDIAMSHTRLANNVGKQIEQMIVNTEQTMEMLANLQKVKTMNIEEMQYPLLETVKAYPLISQIYVMDKSGRQIYKTSGLLENRADRDYFKKAITGEVNFSDVFISGSTLQPIVTIARPINNGQEIVGVLGASIELAALSDLVVQNNLGKTGQTFIVDKNGKIIAHGNADWVAEMKDLSDLKIVQAVMKGEEDLQDYKDEDGKDITAAYVPIEKTGWGVIVQQDAKEAYDSIAKQKRATNIALGITVLLGVLIALVLANYITKPLLILSEKIKLAADGDLKAKVTGKLLKREDEFGQLAQNFNGMMDINEEVVSKIRVFSKTLQDSSLNLQEIIKQNSMAMEEVAQGINNLASRAIEDAETTAKSTESMDQVSQGAEHVAKIAENLNELVHNMSEVIKEGANLMHETLEDMNDTSLLANDIGDKMANLEKSAKDIGNFVTAIIEIAEQTNLLALNAAIEAARAGDAGRGFAVVAEEIRKLAEESNDAADKITNLVEVIQEEVQATADVYLTANSKIKTVAEKTTVQEENMGTIVVDAERSLQSVEEIASVSEEQAAASQEVTSMMDSLQKTINETASTSQEINASTEEQTASMNELTNMAQNLNGIARDLEDLIKYFK